MSDPTNNGMNLEPQNPSLDALFGDVLPPQIDLGGEPPVAAQSLQPPTLQPQTTEQAIAPQAVQALPVTVPQPAQPVPQTVPAIPAQPAPQPEVQQSAPLQAEPQVVLSQPTPVQSAPQTAGNVVDLFGAVVAESEENNVAALLATLANKPPVFESGSIRDEITDPNMTFEQLRVKMSADLPELEARGHVSWSVSYGSASERVTDPDKTTVFSVKSKIEQSKKFKDSLAKRKKGDKDPVCTVRPTVTAQKKGVLPFPNYKGMYDSTADAAAAGKAIAYVPAQDGRVYEMRRNEIGTFIAPASHIAELENIGAGFSMSLPRVPASMIGQIISFFRAVCAKYGDYEALVNVLWDRQHKRYTLHVPSQRVTPVCVKTDLTHQPDPARYLHVMDVHSHNRMAARFSHVDDRDEQATRLYMVVGRLDKYYPDIRCRFACGGRHIEIPVEQVCEQEKNPFEPDWLCAVSSISVAAKEAA